MSQDVPGDPAGVLRFFVPFDDLVIDPCGLWEEKFGQQALSAASSVLGDQRGRGLVR